MNTKKARSAILVISIIFFIIVLVYFLTGSNVEAPSAEPLASADGTIDGLDLSKASPEQLSPSGDAVSFEYVYDTSMYDRYIKEYGYDDTEKLLGGGFARYNDGLPSFYNAVSGARDANGYPVKTNFLQEQSTKTSQSLAFVSKAHAQSVPLPGTSYVEDEDYVGLYHCKESEDDTSFFSAYFEDEALYAEGEAGPIGFADPVEGDAKKIAACDVLVEFDQMLMLDTFDRNPDIIFYAVAPMPGNLLMDGSSYFLDFSDNFSHSFLHDYIVVGTDRSPGTANFDGFISVNHNFPWAY